MKALFQENTIRPVREAAGACCIYDRELNVKTYGCNKHRTGGKTGPKLIDEPVRLFGRQEYGVTVLSKCAGLPDIAGKFC